MAGLDGDYPRLLVVHVVAFELMESKGNGCKYILIHNCQLSIINYQLHRHAAVLLGWQALLLASELRESATDTEAGVAWLDDIINITILGSLIRISEEVGIFLLLLSEECLNILSSFLLGLSLTSREHCYGTTGTHNGNLGRWPSEVEVGTQLLASHHDVATAIALTQGDGDLWNGSLTVSIEQLCSVQDYGIVLLTCTRQESRNVYQ